MKLGEDKNITNNFYYYAISAFNAQVLVQIMHPFDVVKTRLQSHDGSKNTMNVVPKYAGSVDAFKQILNQEGARGLVRGIFFSMFSNAFSSALFFSLYETSKQTLKPHTKNSVLYSSVFASVSAVFVTQPLWTIKTRMLLNTNQSVKGFYNLTNSTFQIFQQHGLFGFYRGLNMSLLLCSHGVIQMSVYEQLNDLGRYLLGDRTPQWYTLSPFISGIISKITAIYITYPLTTIRTRIQQNQFFTESSQPKYSSEFDIIVKTWKLEGTKGFFKGVIPSIIRGLPSKGFYFFFYEIIKNQLVK